jgi:hypothetical protein
VCGWKMRSVCPDRSDETRPTKPRFWIQVAIKKSRNAEKELTHCQRLIRIKSFIRKSRYFGPVLSVLHFPCASCTWCVQCNSLAKLPVSLWGGGELQRNSLLPVAAPYFISLRSTGSLHENPLRSLRPPHTPRIKEGGLLWSSSNCTA